MKKKGLEPLINRQTKILILGSLPSDISISYGQYYANTTNDFWKIMSDVLKKPLVGKDYSEKKKSLLEVGVGLWDVFRSAEREGSMDHKIEQVTMNDFSTLKRRCPALSAVYFNGKKAGEYFPELKKLGYEKYVLPSSSGANRSNQIGRLSNWMKIRTYLK